MTSVTQFGKKTIVGFLWSAFEQGGRVGGNFIMGIILARLLGPDIFGLMAMVYILVGFAEAFVNFGFGPALIQKQKVSQIDLSSVFWLNIIIGSFLTLLLIISTPLIVAFYDEPRLFAISIAISPIFLIRSLNIIQKTLLHKKLNFKTQAKVELISIFSAGLIAILLAYLDFGIWSLITQQLLMVSIAGILYWLFSSWRPNFIFKIESIKSLFKYSSFLFASQFIGYWTRNMDKLLIGKYYNSISLGVYSQAHKLISLPSGSLQDIVMRVLFPSFSTIQDNPQKIANTFLKMVKILGLISFPMMMILHAVANEFILLLYGNEWESMIPILKIMCFVGMMIATNGPQKSLFLSLGKSDWLFYLSLFQAICMVLAISISISYNLEIIALAICFVYIFRYLTTMVYGGKLINITLVKQLKNLFNPALIALIMWTTISFIDVKYGNLQTLAVKSIVALILYFILLYILEKNFIISIIRNIKKQ